MIALTISSYGHDVFIDIFLEKRPCDLIHQYQISKIENGKVDLRVSSLIELARALDLDLKLVPRKAVPAVDNIVRSIAPKNASTRPSKELARALAEANTLKNIYPDLGALTQLLHTLASLKTVTNIGKELEALRDVIEPIHELQKLTKARPRPAKALDFLQNRFARYRMRRTK